MTSTCSFELFPTGARGNKAIRCDRLRVTCRICLFKGRVNRSHRDECPSICRSVDCLQQSSYGVVKRSIVVVLHSILAVSTAASACV